MLITVNWCNVWKRVVSTRNDYSLFALHLCSREIISQQWHAKFFFGNDDEHLDHNDKKITTWGDAQIDAWRPGLKLLHGMYQCEL
jgi:hypothetical protein